MATTRHSYSKCSNSSGDDGSANEANNFAITTQPLKNEKHKACIPKKKKRAKSASTEKKKVFNDIDLDDKDTLMAAFAGNSNNSE